MTHGVLAKAEEFHAGEPRGEHLHGDRGEGHRQNAETKDPESDHRTESIGRREDLCGFGGVDLRAGESSVSVVEDRRACDDHEGDGDGEGNEHPEDEVVTGEPAVAATPTVLAEGVRVDEEHVRPNRRRESGDD